MPVVITTGMSRGLREIKKNPASSKGRTQPVACVRFVDERRTFRRTLACSNNCSIKPRVPNARSIRNALDRMRLRQANRLVTDLDRMLTAEDIMSLEALDVLASRVFLNASNG